MSGWHYAELALTALAAMLSPTTLTFSVLVLVLSKRALRSGLWFYLGALGATVAVGVIAAFVIGDAAAPAHPSGPPKLWVAIIDVVAAVLLVALVIYYLRRPRDPRGRKSGGPDIEGGRLAGSRPHRGRGGAGQRGRVHPAGPEGHLRDAPDHYRLYRRVGAVFPGVVASPGRRPDSHLGSPRGGRCPSWTRPGTG